MRVLHISTYKSGGAGAASFRVHSALREKGIESYFLSTEQKADESIGWFTVNMSGKPWIDRLTNRIKRSLDHLKLIVNDPFNRLSLLNQLQEARKNVSAEYLSVPVSLQKLHLHPMVQQADIIHLHWVANLLDYPSFFKYINKPIVWTLHDLNPILGCFHFLQDEEQFSKETMGFDEKLKLMKVEILKNFKYPIQFIVPSRYFYETFQSHYKGIYPIQQIAYVRPKVKIDEKDIDALREKMDFKKADCILLVVATNLDNDRKGFDLFLNAVSNFSNSYKILAIGQANKELSKISGIRFTGFVSDPEMLAKYYSLAHVLIIPSREDNLPNVMLEAFAAGTPVISFKVGGMKEHVQNGITGLKAEEITSESLAETIEKFIGTKHLYQRSVIQKYAEKHFVESHIVALHCSLYKSMLLSLNKKV